MAWALVTPASRGIGHALTRHLLLTTPSNVAIVATTRSDDPDRTRSSILSDLDISAASASRLDVHTCDLNSEPSIRSLAVHCGSHYNDRTRDPRAHLRLAFCIPGMLVPERAPEKIDYDSALDTLKLNLLAPMMLAKHFVPFLPKNKNRNKDISIDETQTQKRQQQQSQSGHDKVEGLNDLAVMAFMSARVGSISDNARGGWYSYRSSKAGVNQLVKTLNLHLQMTRPSGGGARGGAVCVGLHPGTVKTDLSKEFWASTPKEKLFDPAFSAQRLIAVVRDLNPGMGGRCWDWNGQEIMP